MMSGFCGLLIAAHHHFADDKRTHLDLRLPECSQSFTNQPSPVRGLSSTRRGGRPSPGLRYWLSGFRFLCLPACTCACHALDEQASAMTSYLVPHQLEPGFATIRTVRTNWSFVSDRGTFYRVEKKDHNVVDEPPSTARSTHLSRHPRHSISIFEFRTQPKKTKKKKG
ncbi:uncharacterized protein LY79DRAFT_549198 [Colletotrichum navitas]|uniref:Uncharacterized protein n=1 Tax=Colletotrichum navitas TaxID=681940 RepID=A0AAD8Q2M8_9PEZI|nr:uncharacterized protein LY79DRAFT_549198 [Colletotrichum navitas]KAK1594608.1 hypothetical protein LY79DRAFT_549198 [Colletotrichum navitas]